MLGPPATGPPPAGPWPVPGAHPARSTRRRARQDRKRFAGRHASLARRFLRSPEAQRTEDRGQKDGAVLLCPLSSVLCPLSSVLCPLSSVLCPLSSVLWLLADVHAAAERRVEPVEPA